MDTGLQSRRVRVNVEVTVEITDAAALVQRALASVAEVEFTDDGEREARREEIMSDPRAAVRWLVDPFGLLPPVSGARIVAAWDGITEVNESGSGWRGRPDFVALFSVCRCGEDACGDCGGYQLTPRTAAVLWTVAQILADGAFDDVTQHGDQPVADTVEWSVFSRYPRITWRQDAVWRRQAARCFDDLTGDIAAGRWPSPTCPGEEMALHLILDDAPAAVGDGWPALDGALSELPEHPDDYDWTMTDEVLFQDHDVLSLFDMIRDGIEEPDSTQNQVIGMGDYRPQAWFRTFLNREPRDGRRPFRR
jgi:hypothetical protein